MDPMQEDKAIHMLD